MGNGGVLPRLDPEDERKIFDKMKIYKMRLY